jgi:nicotinate-nucleotide adenylyltransferase
MQPKKTYSLIGIYGGTFNPIHFGHLRVAQEVADNLNLEHVKFIPSATPPHKPLPEVTAQQRVDMVKIAIKDNDKFNIDTRELERGNISYTIDTLKSLQLENIDNALCFLMGTDAFFHFNTWHRWEEILNYCHIVLFYRPIKTNNNLSIELEEYLKDHYAENCNNLNEYRNGLITMQNVTPLTISSTHIRELLKNNNSANYLTAKEVLNYISTNNLYR